jgi:hypothetical protein
LQVALLSLAATGGFFIEASRAACADNVGFFAGGQADFSNYVFMGATVALPGSSIGTGFALRGLVTTGGYNYINTGLGTIKANFGGGELDAVYQLTLKSFWSDLAVGVNDTYTNLVPYDPTNPLRGQQAELRVSSDGGKVAGPWRADWFGYYGPRLEDYEARIDGTHALSSLWRLGIEAYAEGNPTYHLHQVGPFAGVNLGQKTELQFSAGEAWESGFTPRAYVRAFIYQRF